MEKARKEFFTGYIKDGKLICVCDAPDMPHGEGAYRNLYAGIREKEGICCVYSGACNTSSAGIGYLSTMGMSYVESGFRGTSQGYWSQRVRDSLYPGGVSFSKIPLYIRGNGTLRQKYNAERE